MRVTIFGATGMLGYALIHKWQEDKVTGLGSAEADIRGLDQVTNAIEQSRPDWIVLAAAYTDVDGCELNPALAMNVNTYGAVNVARAAAATKARLLFVSTDYVFDGKAREPYTEKSEPFPLSVYANSKLAGEFLVRTTAKKGFVIRTCGLYGVAGSQGKGGNFVQTMLAKARRGDAIRVVHDQVVTPTYTVDLAAQIGEVLPTGNFGLFHMTNEGSCTWYEFAQAIFELSGLDADLSPTTSDLYKTPAIRPKYSVLENARLKELGLNRMRHWREALAAYLK